MRFVYALTAITFWVLACVPEYALAFTPVLSRSQVAAATSDGQRMEKKQRGYQAPQNILFAAPDTLRIRVGQSPVDAIIVVWYARNALTRLGPRSIITTSTAPDVNSASLVP